MNLRRFRKRKEAEEVRRRVREAELDRLEAEADELVHRAERERKRLKKVISKLRGR